MRLNGFLALRQSARAISRLSAPEIRVAALQPFHKSLKNGTPSVFNATAVLPSTSLQFTQKRFARVAVPPSTEIAPKDFQEVENRIFKAFKGFERWPEGKKVRNRRAFLCVRPGAIFVSSIRGYADKEPLTISTVHERIMLVCQLFDKIDPEKITMESHFQNDLGLDSLDHVEVIMQIEDEFNMEIPDGDAERLMTPKDIHQYICDKEDVYE